MADVELKRGYEVLPDNNIRFGIRITNVSELAISDVEVILDYTESLFKLEGDRMQKVGVIPPANTRTAEFVLKPLGCVHKVNIEALISYRDAKYARQRIDMHPKEVHCVCPFLKGKAMPRAEFLELSDTGHSAETGLNFKGVDVERLTLFLVQTCKSRHYTVDDFSIDGGRMLYLASESIGEKAYYLLTALVKESKDDGGLTQVMLRAVSDKPYGLNGFLSETVADLQHVVSTVQSAQEIGIIKKEQVINIIDSVVQRTTFGGVGGEGGASVHIQDSVVQRTEFDAGEDRRIEEERLRNEQEERNRKEEEERLRIQKEEEDRKAREEADRERQEKERLWQEKKEKQRKEREEQEAKKRQEELRKKQEEEKEILRKKEAQKAEQERKVQAERERLERERKAKQEGERAAQERIAKKKSKSRTNVFMLVIVLGALLGGFVMFAPDSDDAQVPSSKPVVDSNNADTTPDHGSDASPSSNQNIPSTAIGSGVNYPQLTGFVTDNANIIDPVYEAKITQLSKQIEQSTTVEIAIVTVESLEGESSEMYVLNLFNHAGIGKIDKDNGLLILVAKQEREYRFEFGYGLERIIDDSMEANIGDIIAQNFRNDDYGKGIYDSMVIIEGYL